MWHPSGLYMALLGMSTFLIASGQSEQSEYDPDLAQKMLFASAVAYDLQHPQKCLQSLLPESEFAIRKIANAQCGLDDTCSGYVALSHPEKAIVVAFRGSIKAQALHVLLLTIKSNSTKFLDGEVQAYWKNAFDSLWKSMEKDVKSLSKAYPSYKVWVTGHSLGGTIASLASAWIVKNKFARQENVISYTFGMPRVGNYKYASQHDKLVKNTWRVVNFDDAVPHFPFVITPNKSNGPYHHGVEAYYGSGAASADSPHKECYGEPENEDASCSFSAVPPYRASSYTNHIYYFGIQVGTHCDEI